ncbi:membrane protein [Aureimonas endophytica]|uniref:Membrane protein n=1 Tax=Aureimonas endophytica TaxID=2027858 RepID=A0A917A0S7_9HYPH|nr:DMT family transporter [Aureimonas endophytica]GGE20194.1 membrane protein [Aureimonas endophytica]
MNALLFLLTSLLWGCGALATKLQAGVTPAAWSVSIRMTLAGLILLACGKIKGVRLKLRAPELLFVAAQGILFFAVAFIAFYEATRCMPSGLAALVLSTSSLFAAAFGRAMLGDPFSRRFAQGTAFGLVGVAVIFLPSMGTAQHGSLLEGFAWALLSSLATAAGTVANSRNQRAGVETFAALGWAAVIGGATSAICAMLTGEPLVLDLSLRYLASLTYLTVGASCATFLIYFELVGRHGAARAAYVFTTIPLVALILSSLFEGLHLDARIAIGAAAILIGNVIVLKRKTTPAVIGDLSRNSSV